VRLSSKAIADVNNSQGLNLLRKQRKTVAAENTRTAQVKKYSG